MKKRYVHDMSNYNWASMQAGQLVPIKCMEVLPNETFKIRSEAVIRLDALLNPVMHPLKVKVFHFFSPNRQVWPNWNDFITQGHDGAQSPVHPFVTLTDSSGAVSTLGQRLGLPGVQAGQSEDVNALPFAHYWNIVNKFFLDPNIDEPLPVALTDGDNTANVGTLFGTAVSGGYGCLNVAWKKDYFSTLRADPELGGAVPIPQSGVVSSGNTITLRSATTDPTTDRDFQTDATRATKINGSVPAGTEDLSFGSDTGLEMDETAVMRDLSIAGALQIFRENRQEWGSRIIDYLRKGFGSRISSYELQEPVLLNYGEKTIRFSEVVQTAEDGSNPVGTLRGHGVGGLGSNATTFTTPEHGFIITLAYVMPEPAYLSSAERFWFKNTFTDYFQSEFEHIGNQAVTGRELAFGYASNTGVIGYQNPYDEYRRCLNTISGTFATTDKDWHLARDFGGVVPTLTPAFIRAAPTQRVFADTVGEVYKIFSYNEAIKRSIVSRVVRRRIL